MDQLKGLVNSIFCNRSHLRDPDNPYAPELSSKSSLREEEESEHLSNQKLDRSYNSNYQQLVLNNSMLIREEKYDQPRRQSQAQS